MSKFLVLVFCGTACILAALGTTAFLFHQHAATLSAPHAGSSAPPEFLFFAFVGLPSSLVFLCGVTMVIAGIRSKNPNAPGHQA